MVNSEDMKGESTPLYYAALSGNEKAVGRIGNYLRFQRT
jgi:hypothetical protein